MSIFSTITHSAHAADIDVGGIKGIGPFGFENIDVSRASTQTQFSTILSTVITVLTTIGGLAFVIYFTLGGLKWLTAGGDKTRVETAQKMISNALIGLVVLIASYAIALFIQNALKINILAPVFPSNI